MRALGPAFLLLASCAHPAPGPEHEARAYLDAAARNDVAGALALSSAEARSVSTASIAQHFAAHPGPVEIARAKLELSDGRELDVVREGDQWRIRDGALLARLTRDPRGAARAFLEAAIALDVGRVRAFLPDDRANLAADSLRARLTEDAARYSRALAGLDRTVGAPVIVEGDFASIAYEPRRAMRLVQQRGTWRILDVE